MRSRISLAVAWLSLTGACVQRSPSAGQGPVIATFKAVPATIGVGESAMLTWTVTGATTITLSGLGTVTGTSVTVRPASTTTYSLTATGNGGSATAHATVTIVPAISTCGNGQVDPGEPCDLSAATPIPPGTTCASLGQGFTGGTLTCNSMCQLVTSQCTSAMVPVIASFTATPAAITAGAARHWPGVCPAQRA